MAQSALSSMSSWPIKTFDSQLQLWPHVRDVQAAVRSLLVYLHT